MMTTSHFIGNNLNDHNTGYRCRNSATRHQNMCIDMNYEFTPINIYFRSKCGTGYIEVAMFWGCAKECTFSYSVFY